MALSGLVAVGDMAAPVLKAVQERIPRIRIGSGDDAGGEMGPLITREHCDRVAGWPGTSPRQPKTA